MKQATKNLRREPLPVSGDLRPEVVSAPETGNPGGLAPVSRGYWEKALPPALDRDRLALELKLIPRNVREEAIQVAWVAHLEGDDPRRAVKRWWMREIRHRRRHEQLPDERRT